MDEIGVGWWWLGVALTLVASYFLFRADAKATQRAWMTKTGRSARAYWLYFARRLLLMWGVMAVVFLALWLVLRGRLGWLP